MQKRITDHIRSNVIGYIALFSFAMGGTAYATHPGGANTISSADIVNGEVRNDDLGANAVGSGKIADGSVKNADLSIGASSSNTIADGGIQGVDVKNNTLTGTQIDESTLDIGDAVRAYARVNPASCTGGTPDTCTPDQSKGVSSVTRIVTGRYCVTAPGIDSGQVPESVTVDWLTTSDPQGNASAMTQGHGFGCGPADDGFLVLTERQPEITVDAGGGTNNAIASGRAEFADNVGFTIAIP
jgi:hypothetical protein